MAEAPYLGDNIDILLGQEFLTWLWYRSEYADGLFRAARGDYRFHVRIEQRLVVRGGEGEHQETASVSGSFSPLREARLGLSTGKKVVRALVNFYKDEMVWQVSLKAEDFCLNSFKTPAVSKESENEADEDATFYIKMQFISEGLELIDEVYKQFLAIRLSEKAWQDEVLAINSWIHHDISQGA